ncbi:hypothetical protein [Adlercreutzia sp. ZJ154]|uniref:hypothetical protein n=1 Tax=Adlercreutzia sp. ZJ154 TaxID=2709790 RepID=UPI0013EA81D5|nr:hypothetical protein [Adlercreutzia sp. ZJ154]
MCFRPATVEQAQVCPNCGKKVNAALGKMPSKCPFCKTVFKNAEDDSATEGAQPIPPSVPKRPAAPGSTSNK